MSEKQFALETIERLPDDTSLDAITQRLEFVVGIRKGLDQIEKSETVLHEEVKRQLAAWLSRLSGRSRLTKHVAISWRLS